MSINFKTASRTLDWGGRPLTIETGKIARQADGAVMIHYGSTTVLCTVVGQKKAQPGKTFFPLTVHYQEKTFAVGRIPGGFFKRETKPSEKEVLVSRLIDRPLRPLFPEGFHNEVQVIATVLSYDFENEPDMVALVGCSAALALSGLPVLAPIGAARVGYVNGEYTLNPLRQDCGQLELVVAGTREGVLMVESEASELSEEIMLGALDFGHKSFQPIIDAIESLKAEIGKPDWPAVVLHTPDAALLERVTPWLLGKLKEAYNIHSKVERYQALDAARQGCLELAGEEHQADALEILEMLQSKVLREKALFDKKRVDGRDITEIRPISCEVGILPRTHGSALFTRGETQALVVTTLGTTQDEQIMDELGGEYRERFLLNYNFPPYSVGEVGRLGAPGRREVGHGKLAWRSLNPIMPSKEIFPYTTRTVAEITESNGSSSMATVCGTSLALMDAGVPLPSPVAGIAMGLIKEDKDFVVLSDILGDEDFLGDMDFKVAGTSKGITALQMDIKITSITSDIMRIALDQAKEGRLHILEQMSKAIKAPRSYVSELAPRIGTLMIAREKIRDLIGPGGKTIRDICERTRAKIDVDDEGQVTVAGINEESMQTAMGEIRNLCLDPEVGTIYAGRVVKIMEFGAFVNFFGQRDGLVHISELGSGKRVEKVTDVLKEGEIVRVKYLGMDDRGKVKLTMKNLPDENKDENK